MKHKLDAVAAEAIDLAAAAAHDFAGDLGVGDHLGVVADGERVVTHTFDCTHPGYVGWYWAVTLVRASRARKATVNEVALLPGAKSLVAPGWVPWSERLQAGDIAPGTLLPTADNDPRLEPGYTAADHAPDEDPAEWSQTRTIVAELGLGRERVLSAHGRDLAAQRWWLGDPGPNNPASEQAPALCNTCGYFIALTGGLGQVFGVCANEFSPSDAGVVSRSHGCGGHSDVVEQERSDDVHPPVYDTIDTDTSLFD